MFVFFRLWNFHFLLLSTSFLFCSSQPSSSSSSSSSSFSSSPLLLVYKVHRTQLPGHTQSHCNDVGNSRWMTWNGSEVVDDAHILYTNTICPPTDKLYDYERLFSFSFTVCMIFVLCSAFAVYENQKALHRANSRIHPLPFVSWHPQCVYFGHYRLLAILSLSSLSPSLHFSLYSSIIHSFYFTIIPISESSVYVHTSFFVVSLLLLLV